jgi:ATP-dependent RNA helicase DHX37/DHR1
VGRETPRFVPLYRFTRKSHSHTGFPQPLRLIIMSATLRVSDFAENTTLFPVAPPVLHITTRQHPVTVHFSRRTSHEYAEEAYKKVARIHARLPPGGILVFCTGQNEIVALVKKLEKKFGKKAIEERKKKVAMLEARAKGWEDKKAARKAEKAAADEEESDEEEDKDESFVESESSRSV